jgi:ABC-type multidrug transport system permease subunit
MLFFGVFFGLSFLLSKMQENAAPEILRQLERFINQQSDVLLTGIFLAIVAVLLLISFSLSLYFYKRRDF